MEYKNLQFRQNGCDDLDEHFELIYKTVLALEPRFVIELGVRGGNSTRCIATALYEAHSGDMHSFDPCHFLSWPGEDFQRISVIHNMHNITGEEGFERWPPELAMDFLFVDTDPHTYGQTKNWLETWVLQLLAPGGVAMFHDTEIHLGVRDALADFKQKHHSNFVLHFDPKQMGLGILTRSISSHEKRNRFINRLDSLGT